MLKKNQFRIIRNLLLITLGTALYAATVNTLVIPNHFGQGGVSGVTILLLYLFGINQAISNFAINAILLLIGYRFLERKTLYYTVYAMLSMTLFLEILKFAEIQTENSIVAAVASGVLGGIGIGLVLLGEGTTAGGDIIAMMMQRFLGIKFAVGFLIIDFIVISTTAFTIGFEKTVLTLILVYLLSKAMNAVTEGVNPKKSMMIITKKHQEIGKAIQSSLNRGITVLRGYGFYSQAERDILYVIVSRKQVLPIQRIIQSIDPDAFMTIADVNEVEGEGFTFFVDHSTGQRL